MTISMRALAFPSSAPVGIFAARTRAFGLITRAWIQELLVATIILLGASAVVAADERLQDWIPDVLAIPDDAELVKDRAIGSTVRMFSIATNAEADLLLSDWEDSLNVNGYPTVQNENRLLQNSIEFSGPGILNAKISVAPKDQEGRSIIEFDATLE